MVAAKEKTFFPSHDVESMSRERLRNAAASTTINRIAHYDFRTRNSEKSPIGSKVKTRPNVAVENHQRPREYAGENTPRLRRSHWAPEKSQYQGYFVTYGSIDPTGESTPNSIVVQNEGPENLDVECGDKGEAMASYQFLLPKGHRVSGFLVQKVTVFCKFGKCGVYEDCTGDGCPPCDWEKGESVTYYEAWRVGYNERRPTNPPGHAKSTEDDTAKFTIPGKNSGCFYYQQFGELRLYSFAEVGEDLYSDSASDWKTDKFFNTQCPTTSGKLPAFTDKGPPPFWKKNPVASGARLFVIDAMCCGEIKDTSRPPTGSVAFCDEISVDSGPARE